LSLAENLRCWVMSKPKYNVVPFLVLWGVWLYRNMILFKGVGQSTKEVIKHIQEAIIKNRVVKYTGKDKTLINPLYCGDTTIGFFDGVAKDGRCGIRVIIRVNPSHCYKACMFIGKGTNIFAELVAFWTVLHLSKQLKITNIHVASDSKVVIDWYIRKAVLDVMLLRAWK